jgi:cysteinyl-tRNA synthetase
MVLRLYNTLTAQKEEFRPLKPGEVGMYTCGPTVYQFAHIGNFRAYIFEDILRRYLIYKGYRVTQVMNITDVDDKTIRESRKEGIPLSQYTARYIKAFYDDLQALNIERAEFYPRATEHIGEMMVLIKKLLQKGYAYESEGSIYFEISKFKGYGKLSKVKVSELKPGARVRADEYEKEEARDFALWRAWDEDDGEVFWETEIGKGRPGWHIECSAMSMKYLGEEFDIHTGGIDNIFPHHENEIAQSEAVTGKEFVRYWLHNEHLLADGRKMSKSLGNYYTLRDLLEKGYDARAIRYLLMFAHYRAPINFTEEGLKAAQSTVAGLIDFLDRLQEAKNGGGDAKYNEGLHQRAVRAAREFEEYMDDDLDMPRAMAAIHDLVRETNRAMEGVEASAKNLEEIHDLLMRLDEVLGFLRHERERLTGEDARLLEERELARKRGDYATADDIRSQLLRRGVILEDTPQGVRWRRMRTAAHP